MVSQKNEREKLMLKNGLQKLRFRKNKLENAFPKSGIYKNEKSENE